jgi:hypothetical protein
MTLHANYPFSFPSNGDSFDFFSTQQPATVPAAQSQPQSQSQSPAAPELDFDSFSNGSDFDFEFENTFGLSPGSSTSAPSTNLVSPKSAHNEFGLVDTSNELNKESPSNLNTAEALRQHHFQRFLHYQALAEQAEEQARQMSKQLELYNLNMSMNPAANVNNAPAPAAYGYANQDMNKVVNTMPMQPAPMQQPAFAPVDMWQSVPAPMLPVTNYHAQAQAHMQAHQAAQASFNMAPAPFFMPAQDNTWSRQSTSASSSTSASVPTTPAAMMSVPMATSVTAPSTVAMSRIASSEGEYELDRASIMSEDDIKPQLPTDIPLTNLNGGGRGYVPGETPDDPKKRHRCGVCGRSFARAFNLKVCISFPSLGSN